MECPQSVISARFHRGLINIIVEMIEQLTEHHGNPWQSRIALSGGVFQNVFLTETLIQQLEAIGFQVLIHRFVPSNDGGLALGQAAVAAAMSIDRHS
jgi:hydrogenase maturation protein HypF